ncbi:hypothetical protein MMC21_008029 [Puttea exsequens]|nr:hypothetical protein [Puttea exsequens]
MPYVVASHSVKVRYHVNTFHMVPEGSDVMRYTKQGDLDSLKAAIQSGKATLWDTAPDGWSLLHTAAYNRQLPTVKYLLEIGADTEVADIGARKPADLAILNSMLNGAAQAEHEINKAFAQKDDYLSDFDFTPIHIAVLDLYDPNDHEHPTLEQLLELVDDCNNAPAGTNWAKWKSKYKRRSPLYGNIIEHFRASAYEQPKTFKVIHNLIDQKDKSVCWTPLHWACAIGKGDKIKTLVYHGADPFILSNLRANIMHAAAESKTFGGLDDALDIWRRYPDQLDIDQPNHWGESPLHVAAWGSVENVRKLVEAGANRHVRQEDGQVPLHCTGMTARGQVRMQIIHLLCKCGDGDHINAQDNDGRPPLFDFLDDASCVGTLVNYGASLDLLDGIGRSAFHHACIQNNEETLNTLLRLSHPSSVLVTVKDHEGNTALILALKHRSISCALRLLKLDDVGDMVGQDGWAAIHYAAKLGDCEVLEAVLHHRKFVKGMKTIDRKSAEIVAMEAGNWRGDVKDLLRRHNSIA